ncbi:MAG TPA: nicotinamide riboside transporter PnuC [Burkholderiaceae bacterium]|nr:nicotinamide riboside transporter PnuC [Burkholderiaceae bacterium]
MALTLSSIFINIIQNTSATEWSCNFTALFCIILAARNHVLTWPIGIVSCVLFILLFMNAKLYAEAVLQVFFIATSVYGWWHWSAQQKKPAAPIRNIAISEVTFWIVLAMSGGLMYAWVLQQWTDAANPWVDSQILTLSMLAQWWLMQRNIRCWWIWLAVNTISVPLYVSRDLYVSALFYSLYWVMAIVAYRHWRKQFALQLTK